MAKRLWWNAILPTLLIVGTGAVGEMNDPFSPSKRTSTFFPDRLKQLLRNNIARFPEAKETADRIVKEADFWLKMTDDEIWSLMFGPTITRSWHVWSNGTCPDCEKPVPMYNWIVDPKKAPWKVRCPECGSLFPKNDFFAFYRSGLDEKGVFDPKRADRSLLFNADHPDPNDLLHRYGVDDGDGYGDGGRRWRFIGAYLIYGQWKALILDGLADLAAAYLVTGNPIYARKAGILLDRIADLYPQFDFKSQALVYERHLGSNGYVSIWHDACEETRLLALIFDAVFDGMKDDPDLIAFLSRKAQETATGNPKRSFVDIQRNIEEGLLKDPLKNVHKITSNFPRTPFTLAVLLTVLSWETNRPQVIQILRETLQEATAVDGVTGEKGLAGYSAYAVRAVAEILALFDRVDPDLLPDLARTFSVDRTFRFHIDTWFQCQYYPNIGDAGGFARKNANYAGASFYQLPSDSYAVFTPSAFTLFWKLYQLTKDPTWVQLIWWSNGGRSDGLPHDLFSPDPKKVQDRIKTVIYRSGIRLRQESVNFEKWCLALLRSGKGERERMAWLDYDSGGPHGHSDGMNIGLFAFGLDLLPDFGYPPVQFGGWDSPRAQWYFSPLAHNTVVVDGKDQRPGSGKTTLWKIGDRVRVVRASAPNLTGVQQYQRTVALIDLSEKDFYVVDIFQVSGGSLHDKFFHSSFGKLVIPDDGTLERPSETPYGGRSEVQMRNLHRLRLAKTAPDDRPLKLIFLLDDHYGYRKGKKPVRLTYFDLTKGAEFWLGEGWVALGISTIEDAWIPRLVIRRKGTEPLTTTFVAVVSPYEGDECPISSVRLVPLQSATGEPCGGGRVALEVVDSDGIRDLIISGDGENADGQPPDLSKERSVVQPDWKVSTDASFCVIRRDRKGKNVFQFTAEGRIVEGDVRTIKRKR